MASLFKAEIVLDGELTTEQAREKWEQTATAQARGAKVRGKAVYIHSRSPKSGKYILYYYHNFGGDFCDTMFTGEIFEYDEGKCQVLGHVTASTGIRRFSRALMILSVPLGFLFNVIMYYLTPYLAVLPFMPGDPRGYSETFMFAGAVLVINAIAVLCLFVDNRRVRSITDYLHTFLKAKEEQPEGAVKPPRRVLDKTLKEENS
jgi:hypothetical protein